MNVTSRGNIVELRFPALRAAGSSLMLALFGVACCVIGGATTVALLHSEQAGAASLLAFAFAGVFAIPLISLGLWFVVVALWTASNSLTVEVGTAGLRTERRCLGYPLVRSQLQCTDIGALDVRLEAKYVGIFDSVRHYRLYARGKDRTLLIADHLKGEDTADSTRKMIADKLGRAHLGTDGTDHGTSERRSETR